jgi:hypothetical protein
MDPSLKSHVTAYGAALQNTKLGGGFFLGATNSRAIMLTPPSLPPD